MTLARNQQFDEDGYLLGLQILSDDEVTYYQSAYERLEREFTARNPKGRIANAHHVDPDFWNLASHPTVVQIAGDLIGPDVVLLDTGFFSKPPGTDTRFVAWHQDTTYWGMDPPFAVTLWVALDDSDVENGCMRVIPGSHHGGLLPHGTSKREGNILGHDQEINRELVAEDTAVDMILKAGQASAHHGLLIHGSNPNGSNRRRCGMTIRLTTPDVKPVLDGPHPFVSRPILLRGEDRFGYLPMVEQPEFAL